MKSIKIMKNNIIISGTAAQSRALASLTGFVMIYDVGYQLHDPPDYSHPDSTSGGEATIDI
jgi:hypothetical protein